MRSGVLILGCLAVGTAAAQSDSASFFNPLSASRDGIHLYNVSVYGGYFSGGIPFEVSTIQNLAAPRGTAVNGGSVNVGWSRAREGSNLAISESLSYMTYPVGAVMPNTSATLNWNKKIGQKWTINTGGSVRLVDLQQSFFSATALGIAAGLPSTFDDLSSAMLKGSYTDAQLAAALTGVATSLRPEQAYLYGQHVGSASVLFGATYAYSGRSNLHFNATGSRTQTLNIGETNQTRVQPLIPQTTNIGLSVGWGYSLSPRTQIGLDGDTNRVISKLQDGYLSTVRFSAGRTMSPHWFVRGTGGIGLLTYMRQTGANPSTNQYTLGGTLGYKLRSHTLLASYNRLIGDLYGAGASSTNTANAGWTWKSPANSWSLSANFSYQQLNGSLFNQNESWRVVGGIARSLSPHVFFSVQYVYYQLPQTYMLSRAMLDGQNGVSMSISWSPSVYR